MTDSDEATIFDGDSLKPRESRLAETIGELQLTINDLNNTVEVLKRERAQAEAENTRIHQLFTGGADTPCRTVWRDGVEYVEVPMSELRRALSDSTDGSAAEAHTPVMVEDSEDDDEEPGHGYWEAGDYS